MDDAFQTLIDYLKERGLYDRTIIVLTSDHGEEFGEHGGVGRHFYTLYDELIKVPFIVKMPGSQLAGTVVPDQVRGIDIMPTLMDLLAINFAADLDGTSLVPFMFGENVESLLAVSQQDSNDPLPATSIRSADSKQILRPRFIEGIDGSSRWYRDRAVFETETSTLTLPLAGARDGEEISVIIEDAPGSGSTRQLTLTTERQNYYIVVAFGGQQGYADSTDDGRQEQGYGSRKVIVQAQEPCPADDADCARFRIFDPQEFYALDKDPAELDNRFADDKRADEIDALRSWLVGELANKSTVRSETLELDEETRRQLKSLGYLN